MHHPSVRLLFLFGLFMTTGCARAPEAPFSVGEAVAELPELHQENISDGLRRMFGTPSRPRIVMTSEDSAAEGASDDELKSTEPKTEPPRRDW